MLACEKSKKRVLNLGSMLKALFFMELEDSKTTKIKFERIIDSLNLLQNSYIFLTVSCEYDKRVNREKYFIHKSPLECRKLFNNKTQST